MNTFDPDKPCVTHDGRTAKFIGTDLPRPFGYRFTASGFSGTFVVNERGYFYEDERDHPLNLHNVTPVPAPNRESTLPVDAKERKKYPVASGVLDYFPDALLAVARTSWQGHEQHHPGTPLHWDRSKSSDEADALIRHFMRRGTLDNDGIAHSAKMAWRALALLQKEIEAKADSLSRRSQGLTTLNPDGAGGH